MVFIYIYNVIVKSLSSMLYEKYSMTHEAKMHKANLSAILVSRLNAKYFILGIAHDRAIS